MKSKTSVRHLLYQPMKPSIWRRLKRVISSRRVVHYRLQTGQITMF